MNSGGSLDSADPVADAVRLFQQGRGRDEAFRQIFDTYFRPIERFFARKGLAAEDCRDLTQETFLGIYRALEGYEEKERFAGWLYRVALTTFLKWRRAATTEKRSAMEISRDSLENPEATLAIPEVQLENLLAAEQQQALEAAVAGLPDQMRDCLTLRLHHQLAYREIAVIKKISIETVKAHLFRARKKLEEELAGVAFGEGEI